MAKTLLVGTHGRAGEELVRSAEMILGKMEDVHCFSLLPGMTVDEYMKKIVETLEKLPAGTLCLVDLFGGTPSNVFCALSKKYQNTVVTGVNLAMLMEVYMNREAMTDEELAELAISALKDSSKNATKILQERS